MEEQSGRRRAHANDRRQANLYRQRQRRHRQFRCQTGKPIWKQQRIEPGTYSASPILADGKLYVSNEDGTTTVIKQSDEFEVLAVNKLGDYLLATPAPAGDEIFIRTRQYLYCIRNK